MDSLKTVKRTNRQKQFEFTKNALWYAAYFLCGIVISRGAVLGTLAPFGASFAAAAPKKYLFPSLIGTALEPYFCTDYGVCSHSCNGCGVIVRKYKYTFKFCRLCNRSRDCGSGGILYRCYGKAFSGKTQSYGIYPTGKRKPCYDRMCTYSCLWQHYL